MRVWMEFTKQGVMDIKCRIKVKEKEKKSKRAKEQKNIERDKKAKN